MSHPGNQQGNLYAQYDGSSQSAYFFFSSRRRHTRLQGDWSSDVCSSDLFMPCSREPARACRGAASSTTLPLERIAMRTLRLRRLISYLFLIAVPAVAASDRKSVV